MVSKTADAWDAYFSSISQFLVDSERQYGVCIDQYTHYVLEQLELIEETCSVLMRSFSHASLHQLRFQVSQLLICVQFLKTQWEEYSDNIVKFIGWDCQRIYWHARTPKI